MANLETVLLSRDEALLTACKLRFAEGGVALTMARTQAEFKTALRETAPVAVLLDTAWSRAILELDPGDAVAKLAPLLASRVLLALTEPGAPPETTVRLLELGAHDVVQKPLKPRILAEQVKALVRVFARGQKRQKKLPSSPDDSIVMDYPARRCFLRRPGGAAPDREVKLTRVEFQVLHLLLQKKGALTTYADFRENLWPDAASPREIKHTLHQLVTNIRRKIAACPAKIENLRAEGFRLVQ